VPRSKAKRGAVRLDRRWRRGEGRASGVPGVKTSGRAIGRLERDRFKRACKRAKG